jgi:hypothetical protein
LVLQKVVRSAKSYRAIGLNHFYCISFLLALRACVVFRQYESKERVLHSQLVGLSGILPVLQSHLVLCHSFSSMATKFQFLDLAYPMIDRLNLVSQHTQPLRYFPFN